MRRLKKDYYEERIMQSCSLMKPQSWKQQNESSSERLRVLMHNLNVNEANGVIHSSFHV